MQSIMDDGVLWFALQRYFGQLDRDGKLFEIRRKKCEALQRETPLLHDREPEDVMSISAAEASPAVFKALTRGGLRPLVVRGLLADAKSTRMWSIDYLSALCGDVATTVLTGAKNDDPLHHVTGSRFLTIGEILEAIRRKEPKTYINNFTMAFVAHPELERDMELRRMLVLLEEQDDQIFEAIGLFAAGPGTGSSLHCAFGANFFNMIVGRKEWTLIDPAFTSYLLPLPTRPFFNADAFFDPDHEVNGAYTRKLPRLRTVLEPGDLLYVPPWWWHKIKNRDDFTVGCAVRSPHVLGDFANNLPFTMMSVAYKVFALRTMFGLKKRLLGGDRDFRRFANKALAAARPPRAAAT